MQAMSNHAKPRIEFYDGGRHIDDPVTLAAKLAARACDAGAAFVLILATDDAQARALDARLWEIDAATFLPHTFVDDPDADAASVLIAAPVHDPPPSRPVVVNLRVDAVTSECERIIELIPADEDGKAAARERWRRYQALGLQPAKIEMGDSWLGG